MIKNLKISIVLVFTIILVIPSQAQTRLNKIVKSGVLKVGMTGEQPPYSMMGKDGNLMGYEVELAEILAEAMKLELQIVQKPFGELIPALEKGEVDMVMSGMTITMERNMKVAFVGPYMLSGKSILTKSASIAKAEEAEDLNQSDLKISALKGSTSEEFVKVLLPEAQLMATENYDMAVKKLIDGEANVMLADYSICVLTILQNPAADLVTLPEPLTIEPIGIALPPNDPLLINFVENYFNALILGGILDELEMYWFNNGSWLVDMK